MLLGSSARGSKLQQARLLQTTESCRIHPAFPGMTILGVPIAASAVAAAEVVLFGPVEPVELGLQVTGLVSDIVAVAWPAAASLANLVCPVVGVVGIGIGMATIVEGLTRPGQEGVALVTKGATSCILGSVGVALCIASAACPPLLVGAFCIAALDIISQVYLAF